MKSTIARRYTANNIKEILKNDTNSSNVQQSIKKMHAKNLKQNYQKQLQETSNVDNSTFVSKLKQKTVKVLSDENQNSKKRNSLQKKQTMKIANIQHLKTDQSYKNSQISQENKINFCKFSEINNSKNKTSKHQQKLYEKITEEIQNLKQKTIMKESKKEDFQNQQQQKCLQNNNKSQIMNEKPEKRKSLAVIELSRKFSLQNSPLLKNNLKNLVTDQMKTNKNNKKISQIIALTSPKDVTNIQHQANSIIENASVNEQLNKKIVQQFIKSNKIKKNESKNQSQSPIKNLKFNQNQKNNYQYYYNNKRFSFDYDINKENQRKLNQKTKVNNYSKQSKEQNLSRNASNNKENNSKIQKYKNNQTLNCNATRQQQSISKQTNHSFDKQKQNQKSLECSQKKNNYLLQQNQHLIQKKKLESTNSKHNNSLNKEYALEKSSVSKTKQTIQNTQEIVQENNNQKTSLYHLSKLLGKGAFGKVYLGTEYYTQQKVAIKCIPLKYLNQESTRSKIVNEITILTSLRHDNIIRLLEVFSSEQNICLVFEYLEHGDLLQLLKLKQRLDESAIKKIIYKVVKGLQYCHNNCVLHRDIKLDNILIGNNEVKICDFGISKQIKKGEILKEICGTPAYIAPEVIEGNGYQGFSADLWSLGILLFLLATGQIPFQKAQNLEQLHFMILKCEYAIPSYISSDLNSLIRQLLVRDCEQRLTLDQILEHQFLSEINQEMKESQMRNKSNEVEMENSIIEQLKQYGYEINQIEEDIASDKLSHIYACYYLLKQKFQLN